MAKQKLEKKKTSPKAKLAVTQIKSVIGRLPKHKATILGLGLKRMHQTVYLEDTPCIRGMLNKVSYLVTVEQC